MPFNFRTIREQNASAIAKWQHLFDHAKWGMIVCDGTAKTIELMNPEFAKMHGYRVADLTGQPLADVFSEVCKASLQETLLLLHQQGHHVWESWHVRKDGSEFPVQIDATAVTDQGKVVYHVLSVQDITARRRDEDILRESEAHLARAQAQGKLGSWLLDTRNDTLEWSAECYRIFGLTPGTPIDYQTFLERVHRDDRECVDLAWRAAVAGSSYDIQHRIVARGRVRWVRQRAELEYSSEGYLLRALGTTQDITELKQHEEALLKSRQSLRELAAHHEKVREAERTDIAREIHDELGQYLTALRMDAAMIRIRFGEGNPELAPLVASMMHTIDTTIGVVRNLATSLRPGALDMGLVSAAEWLLAGFQERTRIPCQLQVLPGEVVLDDERSTAAFRILQESLTNIARYAEATKVCVRIEQTDNILTMEIRDNGAGFDPAEVGRRKTFGLMGIRERVLQFGGESRIDSALGSGTTVHIWMPCTHEVAA